MSAYDWMDEIHSDVDDFIAAVRHEPTEAQLRALGIYSTRRVGQAVEQRLMADDLRATAKPLPNRRKGGLRLRLIYGLLWFRNRNVALLAVSLVGLWFALNWAAR